MKVKVHALPGEKIKYWRTVRKSKREKKPCPVCLGKGKIETKKEPIDCPYCKGQGVLSELVEDGVREKKWNGIVQNVSIYRQKNKIVIYYLLKNRYSEVASDRVIEPKLKEIQLKHRLGQKVYCIMHRYKRIDCDYCENEGILKAPSGLNIQCPKCKNKYDIEYRIASNKIQHISIRNKGIFYDGIKEGDIYSSKRAAEKAIRKLKKTQQAKKTKEK